MIIFVAGHFQKWGSQQTQNSIVSCICYDAESIDDAQRDFLVSDACLKALNDGYSLIAIQPHCANPHEIIAAFKDAAKASLDALFEAVEERKQKSQEGEE